MGSNNYDFGSETTSIVLVVRFRPGIFENDNMMAATIISVASPATQ
jgi:hypothetical protein